MLSDSMKKEMQIMEQIERALRINKILDLFCGAGGASMGLHRAFPKAEIVGVDIAPQPRYPFAFIQADAMDFDLTGYDLIWASPPCQRFSVATPSKNRERHPDHIAKLRDRLNAYGKPWIIENVPPAPLENAVTLCGVMFGIGVFRHRKFESNMPLPQPEHKKHDGKIGDGKYFSVAGGGGRWRSWGVNYPGISKGTINELRQAMGIEWVTRKELNEAVPPAYSEFLGAALRDMIKAHDV